MANPRTITEWLQRLPIGWLVGNTNGAADAGAQGSVYDAEVTRIKEAVQARFPDTAPSDGLGLVGADRKLIQGALESDDDFRERCKDSWSQWALAGTWAELLFQLYWTCNLQAGSTYIVQQNGKAYSLTSNPGPTTDPTTLLQIEDCAESLLVGDGTGTPWWTFDGRDDLCARFALVVTGPLPPSLQPTCRVTFDGTSSSATGTWTYPWDGNDYHVLTAVATTDGTAPSVALDRDLSTATTATVQASGVFTGYVDLIGWIDDGNPFASPSTSTRNLINLLCRRWAPAKATYMGAFVIASGVAWGWPPTMAWGDPGLVWGDSLVAFLEP